MRTLNGFCFALLFSGAALAQNHAFVNSTPVLRGSFGNVLFPAGVPTNPGTRQVFPNVVFPPGTAPRLYVPNSTLAGAQFSAANRGRAGYGGNGYVGSGYARNGYRGRGNSTVAVPYAVPIYVGGYAGYTGYYDGGQPIDPGVLPSQPGQPNVIVVYPQAPGGGPGPDFAAAPPLPDQPSPSPAEAPANATPATYYLIAFKDHTIYSAVAYWVEGDTLHYFTSGATHNQVSLSLVDRELTLRLNQEAGTNLQLPTN